jgi:hypothetical protein
VIERCLEKDPGRGISRRARCTRRWRRSRPARCRRGWCGGITCGGARRWRRRHARRGAALLVGVNVGGVRDRLAGTPPAPPPIRLAVLPFENLTGDPDQEYLSDGLTDEMITQLGRLHPQRSASSRAPRRCVQGPRHAARRDRPRAGRGLRARGQRPARGQPRAHQRDARSGARSDAAVGESFDRELAGILALQSDVARGVASSLALALLPPTTHRPTSAWPMPSARPRISAGFRRRTCFRG